MPYESENMNRGRSLELVFATPTTPATVHVYKKVLRFKFSFEVCVHEMSLIERLSQYSTVKSIDCLKEDIKNAETVKKTAEIHLRLLNSFLRRPSPNTLRPLLFKDRSNCGKSKNETKRGAFNSANS